MSAHGQVAITGGILTEGGLRTDTVRAVRMYVSAHGQVGITGGILTEGGLRGYSLAFGRFSRFSRESRESGTY